MACGRTIRRAFALALFILLISFAGIAPSQAQLLRATVKADISGGYARLLFTLTDDVDVSVQTSGSVMIISFSKPVFIAVDRLPEQAAGYIGVARRDPDGRAIRLALERKVTTHSIAAAEKYFVDLLPDTWNGPAPPLPQDVVDELARRARDAERLERLAHLAEEQKKMTPSRVHVASQPTFIRYVFDVPDQTSVSADRAKERLTLTFSAALKFDLTDAQTELPKAVKSINAEVEQDSALVRFSFAGAVDVRTFRDDKSFVVDVVTGDKQAGPRDKSGANTLPIVVGREPAPAAKASLEGGSAVEKPAAPKPEVRPPAIEATQPVVPAKPKSDSEIPAPGKPEPSASSAPSAAVAAATPGQARPAETHDLAMSPKAPASVTPPASAESVTPSVAPPAAPPAAKAEISPPSAPAMAPPQSSPPALSVAPAGKAEMPAAATQPPAASAAPSAAPPAAPAANTDVPPPASSKEAAPRKTASADAIAVEMSHQGTSLKLSFPFVTPTAAAVFHRADTLWIVFDSKAAIDLAALNGDSSRTIRGAEFVRQGDAAIVRIRLDHPHLSSATAEGPGWTVTIGEPVADPTRALDISRNLVGATRASVGIAFDDPHRIHHVHDPEAGDDLFVVTGFAPARGFINEQDFIEFRALASTQGVVVEPLADDVGVEISSDKIIIGRPGGLTLSTSLQSMLHSTAVHGATFDSEVWGLDRKSTFSARQSELMNAAASAPAGKRLPQRLDLARFYIARDMYPEAKGVLDVVLTDRPSTGDVSAMVLRALAEVMMDRPDDALKDLSNPGIGDQHDAPLWRALAYAHQGRWGLARDSFKRVEASVAGLPAELQRVALRTEMRTSIEVGDFAAAANEFNDLQTIGLPHELQPAISVLVGRMSEGTGRAQEALTAYRTAADSWDRPSAAQGRLREAALRYSLGDMKRDDVIAQLETLTTIWRGDDTEIGALEILARLYTEEARYRDSFYVMRNAIAAEPNSDITRRIQEQAAATFDTLFVGGRGDALPAIDALALFYDFRELTPIGRRGDEMIRRLADRLVSVDLLDQAADLLQYQVDNRLQGAAQAQVATRLAVIYLVNHKPDRALATLRSTRVTELAGELRDQRLLLEARALSDLGRHDLALDVAGDVDGREAVRLRSDILWAAKRWAPAAEQIELYYGDRWKEWAPLNVAERADILRASVGYALGEDVLGLGRLRERYAAKMAQTPDAHAFAVVSAPLGTNGAEFRDIARSAASIDTLDGFLRDMQARYPDAGAMSHATASPQNASGTTGSISRSAPASGAARPAAAAPAPSARAAGKTAQR